MSRAPRQPHATTSRAHHNQHAARKTLHPANRPSSISHHPTRAKAHQPQQRKRRAPAFACRGETCLPQARLSSPLSPSSSTPVPSPRTNGSSPLSPRVVILIPRTREKELSSPFHSRGVSTQSKLFSRGGSQTRPPPPTGTTQNTRCAFPRAICKVPTVLGTKNGSA